MKIEKIYIRGFGKIENYELDLSDGINIIYGPNESGKSTLMAFIKAVMYGLKGGRADKEGMASGLKRYKPWDAPKYGGYINFKLNNNRFYRLDRDFDSNTVKLYDQEFNDVTAAVSGTKDGKGIADKILGVSENLFERTVYIKQLGTKIDTSGSKDLIDRISNIRQSGWEEVSYKKALSALKEALKNQVGTDRSYTRPLDLISKRLKELSGVLDNIDKEEKILSEAREKQRKLTEEKEMLNKKEVLSAKAVEFLELRQKLKVQREKAEEIRFLTDSIRLSRKNADKISADRVALEQEARQITLLEVSLMQELSAMGKTEPGASPEISPEVDLEVKPETGRETMLGAKLGAKSESLKRYLKVVNICGILAALGLVGTVWGSFIKDILPQYVPLIFVVLTAGSAIIKINTTKEIKKLEAEQSEILGRKEQLEKQQENAKRMKDLLDSQLAAISEREAGEKNQLEQQTKRLEGISQNFSQTDLQKTESSLDSISEGINRLMGELAFVLTSQETALLESVMENTGGEGAGEAVYNDINQFNRFCTGQLQHKRIEKAEVDYRIGLGSRNMDAEAVQLEMNKLVEQKKQLEQRGEALSIAMKTLEEASNEVQKKFLPVMNKVFSSTFSGLTSQKYSDTRAGDNLNIMLSEPGTENIIPVSALSSGAVDQLYLALRIAVSETVLKENEPLPLIMDEPFAQYDDERTDNALNYISGISKRQQVIIFTCKQREVELFSAAENLVECKICSLT